MSATPSWHWQLDKHRLHFSHFRGFGGGAVNGLAENIEELALVSAHFDDTTITLDAEVTQYLACLSRVIVTTSTPSGYLVVGHHNLFVHGLANSLVSLNFGWWGIPWRPIYTVQALWTNIRGGNRQTVGSLVASLAEAASGETEA